MEPVLPRVAITYCTQCRWMLRAAYFGQELLSTFGTTIGEVALIPATGGVFTVTLRYDQAKTRFGGTADGDVDGAGEGEGKGKVVRGAGGGGGEVAVKEVLLWDRKSEGGFPETKILKQRVRDHLDPKKDLGHSDTPSKHTASSTTTAGPVPAAPSQSAEVEVVNTQVGSQQTNTTDADPQKPVKRNADGTVCEDCN